MDKHFKLTIRKRTDIYFTGDVASLSSVNEKGNFDVLPNHANFISLITTFIKYADATGKTFDMPIASGVLRFVDNKGEIFLSA